MERAITAHVIKQVPLQAQQQSPFLCQTREITTYEYIKMVLMLPIVLLRVLLILLLIVPFIVLVSTLATCGHKKTPDDDTEDYAPLPPWRRALLCPLKFLMRALLWCCGYLYIHEVGCCWLGGTEAPVIVANHVSFIDPLYLNCKFLPCSAMMGYLTKVPVLGTVILSLTPIGIWRDTAKGRSAAKIRMKLRPRSRLPVGEAERRGLLEEEVQLAEMPQDTEKQRERYEIRAHSVKLEKAYLARREQSEIPYPPLLVFPEGTTKSANTLLQFKQGAFLSGMPVQPVVCKYPYCNFEVTWSCDMSLAVTFWRMLSQVYNCMTVEYLDVYVCTLWRRYHTSYGYLCCLPLALSHRL